MEQAASRKPQAASGCQFEIGSTARFANFGR